MRNLPAAELTRATRRQQCRALGARKDGKPQRLRFNSPEVMFTFNEHAASLLELFAHVIPAQREEVKTKNREVRLVNPAGYCSGSHSGHCIQDNVVALGMSFLNGVHFVATVSLEVDFCDIDCDIVVVTGGGCKSKDIIHACMENGVTAPLGSWPSVGMGLCLQGGIGHLARQHGLACVAIKVQFWLVSWRAVEDAIKVGTFF